MQPIRVLHIVTYMGRGGLETMLRSGDKTVEIFLEKAKNRAKCDC